MKTKVIYLFGAFLSLSLYLISCQPHKRIEIDGFFLKKGSSLTDLAEAMKDNLHKVESEWVVETTPESITTEKDNYFVGGDIEYVSLSVYQNLGIDVEVNYSKKLLTLSLKK